MARVLCRYVILDEFAFYYGHLWLHVNKTKWFNYRRIHKIHHEFTSPVRFFLGAPQPRRVFCILCVGCGCCASCTWAVGGGGQHDSCWQLMAAAPPPRADCPHCLVLPSGRDDHFERAPAHGRHALVRVAHLHRAGLDSVCRSGHPDVRRAAPARRRSPSGVCVLDCACWWQPRAWLPSRLSSWVLTICRVGWLRAHRHHCGYRWPWTPFFDHQPDFHDFHHEKFNTNYGAPGGEAAFACDRRMQMSESRTPPHAAQLTLEPAPRVQA
jgi:hypothetical protein